MPAQDEQDIENANSRSQQRANRSRRTQSRAARKEYKASKAQMANSGYSSTKILKKLKSDYQKKIEGINSNSYGNQTDANEDISFSGIDSVNSSTDGSGGGDGGGGGLPDGFDEETLDIVDLNNLAAQRIFLTKDVP